MYVSSYLPLSVLHKSLYQTPRHRINISISAEKHIAMLFVFVMFVFFDILISIPRNAARCLIENVFSLKWLKYLRMLKFVVLNLNGFELMIKKLKKAEWSFLGGLSSLFFRKETWWMIFLFINLVYIVKYFTANLSRCGTYMCAPIVKRAW